MWRHLLALTLVGAAEGLYFHVREGERRCFVEEVPDDEIVVGAYTFPEFGKAGEKTKEEHEPTVRRACRCRRRTPRAPTPRTTGACREAGRVERDGDTDVCGWVGPAGALGCSAMCLDCART